MPEQFLHGLELVDIDNGPRPIQTVRSSVIGVVGTAPDADADAFPLNVPVLIAGSRIEAAKLGATGTLGAAMDDIFDQAGAATIVVRVEEGQDANETQANIIGGVDGDTGQRTGFEALLDAKSRHGVQPKLLIAPEFSGIAAVTAEMIAKAERLRGIAVTDGPNSNDADAIAAIGAQGSDRLYMIDPGVKVFDTVAAQEIIRPASARVAGLIAKSDNQRGFWWSPSNQLINGITGTARPIDFTMGDVNSRANILNENRIATIINENGFRLWGNRTASADPKYSFLNVRRTADMIGESILAAHLWAVDRNITRTYLSDVVDGVNAYLRHLYNVGATIGIGEAWADPDLNTPDQIAAGKAYIDFRFSANYPAEHVTFRSHLVNDYLDEVVPLAA